MNHHLKAILALLLALVMLLCSGCAAEDSVEPATDVPTDAPAEVSTEAPTEEPAPIPTLPPVIRNPYNGAAIEESFILRPFAVSINNVKPSMPQYGIGQADIVYEMLVEYGLTRCLAIYSDISAVEKIGSIRSARLYTYSLVQSCDAILVRCGGSSEADAAIHADGWDELDGYYLSEPFYRDKERRNAGYAMEHTMFTSGELILENVAKRNLRTEREAAIDYGLTFTEEATPDGAAAGSIQLVFSGSKSTSLIYNEEAGKYLAHQYDSPWIDKITGDTLAFDNVLILRAKVWTQEDGVHETIQLVGEGSGYFACGGQIIPIRWSRSADDEPFRYTLEDGSPLNIRVGKSYIGIVPMTANISWE